MRRFEARVLLSGRLDGGAADVVREAVRPLWDRTGTRITMDLSGVELIDIAGLALLLRMDALARDATSTITLAGVPAGLDRLLHETGCGSGSIARWKVNGGPVPRTGSGVRPPAATRAGRTAPRSDPRRRRTPPDGRHGLRCGTRPLRDLRLPLTDHR